MKKVRIEEGCISCGLCEEICPEVFKITDIALVKDGVDYNSYKEKIEEAAASCPVEVIKYE